MDPLLIAVIVAVFTLIVLFSGIPIAFGLSFVSIALLVAFEGFQMLDVFAETFYAGLNSFVLLSIPMFILMGMAVANSPAGKDLYTGLDFKHWRLFNFCSFKRFKPSNMRRYRHYGYPRNEKERIF